MRIGGLQRVSLIDYPGNICAILFLQGCNFRCPYCHNPELVDPALYGPCLDEEEIFSFLAKRREKLDAVTITGGEPTIQQDLPEFIRRIKKMGYLVKLDTNGSSPDVLEALIKESLLDYIAMDIKGPWNKYSKITEVRISERDIEKSIELIKRAGIDYEFRTTVVKSLLAKNDFASIGDMLEGSRRYVLQRFVPTKILNEAYLNKPGYRDEELEVIRQNLEKGDRRVLIR